MNQSANHSSDEQRQHIALSQYAYDVMVNDSLTFTGKKNVSGFINTILNNCDESYLNSINIKDIKSTLRNYPKDVTLKIRLRNDIFDYYYNNGKWFGEDYNLTQGQYIKFVIEDYARKTHYHRESVFFKPTIDALVNHINNTDSKKGLLPIILNNKNKYYIKPYKISDDYQAPYHYIICMSTETPKGKTAPSSFRISRITAVKDPVYETGNLKKEEINRLEERIRKNGVSYLLGKNDEFIVKLSPKGLDLYNTIYHLRPIYSDISIDADGYTKMVFHVTERQITNYFFQFGKEAVILSPEKTGNHLKKQFKEAYEEYVRELPTS